MWNYLFEFADEWDERCGERFFVQCDTEEEADEILGQYFWGNRIHPLGKYTDDEAEEMGYDTY